MNCKLQWNETAKEKRKKAFKKMQNEIDKLCIEKMTPYVPVALPRYEHAGSLRDSVKLEKPGTIIYTSPFAKKRYYDTYFPHKTGNPQGSRLWFEVMKENHIAEIKKSISNISRKG